MREQFSFHFFSFKNDESSFLHDPPLARTPPPQRRCDAGYRSKRGRPGRGRRRQPRKPTSPHGLRYRDFVHKTLRPFWRRALMMARPDGVAIRARKPDVRVARRRVPRLVHPIEVLELATTVSGAREGAGPTPGRRAGARVRPVGV